MALLPDEEQVPAKTTHTYDNPAFETDGSTPVQTGSGEQHHLADIVEEVYHQYVHDIEDWHPYGSKSIYDELMGSKRKHWMAESPKTIPWFVFTIVLVGIAGGIIFLSETYRRSLAITDNLVHNRTF